MRRTLKSLPNAVKTINVYRRNILKVCILTDEDGVLVELDISLSKIKRLIEFAKKLETE